MRKERDFKGKRKFKTVYGERKNKTNVENIVGFLGYGEGPV